MKNKIIRSIAALVMLACFACEEEGDKAILKSDVAPNAVQPLSAAAFTLLYDKSGDDFEPIRWTKPDFGFPASVSYTVEIARSGTDFASAYELVTADTTMAMMTVGELNSALLEMGLAPEEPAPIQIRVRSSINSRVPVVYSSPVSVTITPYTTVFPPIYIIGDAQAWNLNNALELQSIAPGKYEAVGTFQNNGKFRLFASPAWDAQQWGWSFFSGGTVASALSSGNDGDSNFLFGGTTGYYRITVSLKDKTIAMEASSAPTLFVIGDAQGWNLANALELHSLGNGQFEVTGQFQMNGKFRFFISPDWAAEQYRYSSFNGGTIDSDLGDGADGDSNFLFRSATGIYKLTVNVNTKAITVDPASEPALYIIGQDQGWNLANAFKLTWLGGGKYRGNTNFTANATFRLFDRPEWPAGFGNYPYFEDGEISTMLQPAGDADSNFRFAGTTGAHTMTVDLYNLKVGME
jgi:hypothetical protein